MEPVVVILAGGTGSRFWPLSTPSRPKQLLTLTGARSLLQATYDRVGVGPERVLVVTSADGVEAVRRQLPELPAENVIGEPLRRDTAAAVALAAITVRRRFGDVVVVVLPSDHHVGPGFQAQLAELVADAQADPDAIFTFGIRPVGPSSAYGYLEPADTDGERFMVRAFHEKPDRDTAAAYVAAGWLWNSGMFVFSVGAMLAELGRQLPEHLARLEREGVSAYEGLRRVSIDHGVMEGARRVRGRVARFEWSDVGGWEAVGRLLPEVGGNRVRGEVVARDAVGNVVFCEDPAEEVVLIGVSDLVVVRAGGRTLVVPRERADEIKEVGRRDNREHGGATRR